jgi:hypothetical protein
MEETKIEMQKGAKGSETKGLQFITVWTEKQVGAADSLVVFPENLPRYLIKRT